MNSLEPKPEKIRSAGEEGRAPKKPYSKPAFRIERVFETSALACGKTPTQHCGPRAKS